MEETVAKLEPLAELLTVQGGTEASQADLSIGISTGRPLWTGFSAVMNQIPLQVDVWTVLRNAE